MFDIVWLLAVKLDLRGWGTTALADIDSFKSVLALIVALPVKCKILFSSFPDDGNACEDIVQSLVVNVILEVEYTFL